MGSGYLMALDAGCGSGRSLVVDIDTGRTTAARRAWTHPAAPGTSGLGYDIDFEDIWKKLGEVSREALVGAGAGPGEVLGIAATSMRNTTVIMDAETNILLGTPNHDARAIGEATTLGSDRGKAVHGITGHWPGPIFTGSRLLWMKTAAPELLARADRVISLSDWLGFRLGGGVTTTGSQAGETLLYDLEERDWAFDLVSSLGLPAGILPEVVDSGAVIGALSREAGEHLGLTPGIPVVAGGADTQCGLLGAGAIEDGQVGIIAGTSMPLQLSTRRLIIDPEGRFWSGLHVIGDLYVLESNGLTAGEAIEWFSGILYPDLERPLTALGFEASGSPPGAEGAYSTIGAHVFDARWTGIPMGNITLSHMTTCGGDRGRQNIARALLEGIAYSARANLDQLLEESGYGDIEIILAGGMSVNGLWVQILSDVTGRPISVPQTPEVSSLGTAICAGVGAGVFPDLEEGARSLPGAPREYLPGESADSYRDLYTGWREVHDIREAADRHASGLMALSLFTRRGAAPEMLDSALKPRILVTAMIDDDSLRRLAGIADVDYRPWRESGSIYQGGTELVEALSGYEVFVTEIDTVDFEAIRDLPGLRAVITCRGNPVNVDIESATAFGIPVFNTPGRNADAVADLAVAFMIMLSRKLPDATRFLSEGNAKAGDLARMGEAYMKYEGNELRHKTVGIVGMGNVGQRVAKRTRCLGSKVIFYDPSVTSGQGALLDAEKVSFEELLSRSDIVTLHAPATEENRNMLDGAGFGRMKDGSFLINTSRASLVDHDALLEALESGHLAGAALDVFPVEPPASDDRLVSRDDVIATPHIGGNTFEITAHQGDIVVRELEQLLGGQAPDNILNPGVMDDFHWGGPRREPPASELEILARKPKPRITS